MRSELLPKLFIDFPAENKVYDYKFEIEKKQWIPWLETIETYQVDTRQSFNEILVPTQDSIRMKFLCKLLLTNGKHVLLPGPTGTGKSVNTSELLTYELPEEF